VRKEDLGSDDPSLASYYMYENKQFQVVKAF